MAKNKYYAVQKGRVPGIYDSWDKCKEQVDGFQGAVYKGFANEADAQAFLGKDGYDPKPKQAEPKVPNTAYAFVDGSYNPATGVSGYGGFLTAPADGDAPRERIILQGKTLDKKFCEQRNVAGELLGTLAAVEQAHVLGYKDLTIFYDYEGIRSWASGDWKANNPYTKNYAERIRQYQESGGMNLNFVHTKGHTGIEGNELADKLAKEAVGVSVRHPAASFDMQAEPSAGYEF